MDASIAHEINILDQNKNKIDSSNVYDMMIHSIKGKYVCEETRKKFVISRSLPLDKIYQPQYAEPFARDFLNCYADMIKVTKESCQDKYKNIFECLVKNHGKNYDFPVKCVSAMEDFINC
jgi:hypothetical protein